ncbi:MAG: hypothetical protein L0L93_05815 [Brevibacterium sp.]|nr:hypothetical protein [Brevibacterium sp.]MDN5834252.1 hypothetical protein [Brevibacterium sp.]MDN5876206.1 hypothetical protein [Brevibacterium sp.]MDN6159051.1 hypothetical protein [Brevibacterium sp.]MDN6190340.1 hypothetical protein [Brevibacterium sp.]
MYWPLTPREKEVALAMIRNAGTSPDEQDYAGFTDDQRQGWDRPTPITPQQRLTWETHLAEVVVTNPCDCGFCPSIGMKPMSRIDDGDRDDTGGLGDYSSRIILDAAVEKCMLLLFIDDDIPSYLELAPTDGEHVYSEFPPPERILY